MNDKSETLREALNARAADTLLERARSIPVQKQRHYNYGREEMDLALAWATGEISVKQAGAVLERNKDNGLYGFLGRALRAAYAAGLWVKK